MHLGKITINHQNIAFSCIIYVRKYLFRLLLFFSSFFSSFFFFAVNISSSSCSNINNDNLLSGLFIDKTNVSDVIGPGNFVTVRFYLPLFSDCLLRYTCYF